MPKLGFLGPTSAAGFVPFLTAFREGLSASRYVAGEMYDRIPLGRGSN